MHSNCKRLLRRSSLHAFRIYVILHMTQDISHYQNCGLRFYACCVQISIIVLSPRWICAHICHSPAVNSNEINLDFSACQSISILNDWFKSKLLQANPLHCNLNELKLLGISKIHNAALKCISGVNLTVNFALSPHTHRNTHTLMVISNWMHTI